MTFFNNFSRLRCNFSFFENPKKLKKAFFQPKSAEILDIFKNLKMENNMLPEQLYKSIRSLENANDYIDVRMIANWWLCVLCGRKRRKKGHSPTPFSDGERYRCCGKCYDKWVLPYIVSGHYLQNIDFTQKEVCGLLELYMELEKRDETEERKA